MAAYYDRRAGEYDDWYLGRGRFAARRRPGFGAELEQVAEVLSSLPPARTLDVGCGTGFVTRYLPGEVVALDRSLGMLQVARPRVRGTLVSGDVLALPFRDRAFDRLLTGHVYGHLTPERAAAFLAEARRVASELLVLDTALRPGVAPEQVEERILDDGSSHRVLKRYFEADELAEELGGGEVLLRGDWFVLVRPSSAARAHPG
jgi:demethylmenaquinone methyltransferase/2-methoxy-6-polyprenyl-1,4-benzoquinol methylase